MDQSVNKSVRNRKKSMKRKPNNAGDNRMMSPRSNIDDFQDNQAQQQMPQVNYEPEYKHITKAFMNYPINQASQSKDADFFLKGIGSNMGAMLRSDIA